MSPAPLPRILLVDDESNVLDGLRRQLRGAFDVSVASSGAEGLVTLRDEDSFDVVCSDFRMPGMNGAEFLAAARSAAPDTTRVLLTGQADLPGTAAVVNEGEVYRLLLKPVSTEELVVALHDAVEHHRLVVAEKELLEQTLQGSVKALAEVLALTNAALFDRTSRVRRLVGAFLDHLDIADRWSIDLAAALVHLGAVSLPPTIAKRIESGLQLTSSEQKMLDRVPEVTEELLAHIPRLEPVREAIRYSGKDFAGGSSDDVSRDGLPLGSRILRIAIDFDALTSRGTSEGFAVEMLSRTEGRYDPRLLEEFGTMLTGRPNEKVIEVMIDDLEPGMILDADLQAKTGAVLVPRGWEITSSVLARVRNFAALQDGVAEPIAILVPRDPHARIE
jgi:response regulator RpfG family c-di-GMP phosphodiesterase